MTSRLEGKVQPINEWAEPLADTVLSLYESLEFNPPMPEDQDLLQSLKETGALLRDMARVRPELARRQEVSVADAVRVILRLAATKTVPEADRGPAIELLDWFEIPVDDAPVKVIVGVNEGSVPEPIAGDPFLPDTLRQRLGLASSKSRYARDAFYLQATLCSTPNVFLIVGRTASDGQPTPPSRLLLACDDRTLVRRARRFFSQRVESGGAVLVLYEPGDYVQFCPPRPDPNAPLPDSLPVTAFRDYLTCPYRFYLKHILRLESLQDRVEELDPPSFGSIVHQVISIFSRRPVARSGDLLYSWRELDTILQETTKQLFGTKLLTAVDLQIEHIRRRLRRFAKWHCERIGEGWQMLPEWVERPGVLKLDVDGKPFEITGRIDRVERNAVTGQIAVLDYKTSDTERDPEKAHRRTVNGVTVWTDLQLPLYRYMVDAGGSADVLLAFVSLDAQRETNTPLHEAKWTREELSEALECAYQVVRDIRQRRFWPPSKPEREDDEFAAICMDRVPRRDTMLSNPTPPWELAS